MLECDECCEAATHDPDPKVVRAADSAAWMQGDPIGEDTNNKLSGGMIFLIIILVIGFLVLIAICVWYVWKKNKESQGNDYDWED